MSAADQVRQFSLKVRSRSAAIFQTVVEDTRDSIVEGSVVTGAPGQPVDTGALRASWQTVRPSPTRAVIGTNLSYAKAVEDGVGPEGPRVYGRKNNIGGSHSVKMTVRSFDRIVAHAVARVKRGTS